MKGIPKAGAKSGREASISSGCLYARAGAHDGPGIIEGARWGVCVRERETWMLTKYKR